MSPHRDTYEEVTQRIREHLPGRLHDFRRLTAHDVGETDEERDEREEELYAYPLGVESFRLIRIDLSTGGPADWLEVQLDSENEPRRIEYHYAPWFDHASVTLEGDDFAAADAFARSLTADYYFPADAS